MSQSKASVHVWVPELTSTRGGIQAFSRHLVEAVATIAGGDRVRVFSKNDRGSAVAPGTNVVIRGFGKWPPVLRTTAFAVGIVLRAIQDRPALIITTHLNFGVAAYMAKRLSRSPYWCVAHGIEAWNLGRKIRSFGLRKTDLVLAVSNYTRRRLLDEQTMSPDKIVILPNTVRGESLVPGPKPDYLMRRHGLTDRHKIILTVARLAEPERYKGYDNILRALPKVRQSIPEIHYVLVGGGADRPRVEQLIRDLEVADIVTLAGAAAEKELGDYYNLCDVFAMPSKGEGFGIVYLEAMACGKPVLAGKTDGSADPLQDGRVGLLVDPDDVSAMAVILTQVLNGNYPSEILYSPEKLRAATLERFGFDRFVSRVNGLLSDFAPDLGVAK